MYEFSFRKSRRTTGNWKTSSEVGFKYIERVAIQMTTSAGNANAQQKARLLEAKVSENLETIGQLREERTLLAKDHKDLQKQFTKITEHADRLREEYTASQTSHENRRHQLDLHFHEIEDLRRALSDKADELQAAESEKRRMAAERSDVGRTIAALEADLRRVRKDAEAFGRDLKLLRAEKENTESQQKDEIAKLQRSKKQAQAQIRILTEQLDGQKAKTQRARDELESHICAA
jgi:chromosome segregation ATPase